MQCSDWEGELLQLGWVVGIREGHSEEGTGMPRAV